MNYVIVSSKQLGNRWSPRRFCGGRCNNVKTCTYAEKKTCKAIQAEIDHLNVHYGKIISQLTEQHAETIAKLKGNGEQK
jgi:hypothetical protein